MSVQNEGVWASIITDESSKVKILAPKSPKLASEDFTIIICEKIRKIYGA